MPQETFGYPIYNAGHTFSSMLASAIKTRRYCHDPKSRHGMVDLFTDIEFLYLRQAGVYCPCYQRTRPHATATKLFDVPRSINEPRAPRSVLGLVTAGIQDSVSPLFTDAISSQEVE